MNTLLVGFGSCWIRFNERVFLGGVETIVGSLLCCGVDIVQCLFTGFARTLKVLESPLNLK